MLEANKPHLFLYLTVILIMNCEIEVSNGLAKKRVILAIMRLNHNYNHLIYFLCMKNSAQ